MTSEEAQLSTVASRGAVDLTRTQAQPDGAPAATPTPEDPCSVRLDVPLVVEIDEANFQEVLATSQTVPVVLVLVSAASLDSRGAVETMTAVARRMGGRFQLATADVARVPQLAQALQVQGVPTVVAFVAGRPVPLFQGMASEEQISEVLTELLGVAAQMGVTGGVAVNEEQSEEPTPDEHLPALAAEEAGDLVGAVAAWEKVIELNPRDERAKSELARVRLALRQAEDTEDASTPSARADALFAQGRHADAFQVLLDQVASTREEARDEARVHLLDLFRVAGNTPEVRAARARLSTLLMI